MLIITFAIGLGLGGCAGNDYSSGNQFLNGMNNSLQDYNYQQQQRNYNTQQWMYQNNVGKIR